MNDQDFEDACAMLSMVGMIIAGKESDANIPERSFQFARMMVLARNTQPEEGIVAIKKRIKK